ncbi:FIST N-terminal domain-containing protein [Yoonia maritima]|uniref:FIST N-terminal domain-containing protein n=1 Tax=Yoonia maritima TaxID=1435347 RepID=UPI0013A640BA|nr:FIST N-terminal domain-containing protein [Yoonia maritima]
MNMVDGDFTGASIVSVGVSMSADPDIAVSEAAAQLPDEGICFVLVFVPECLDTSKVAAGLAQYLPQTLAFGCTTGGQITPQGYADNALMLVSFPRDHFRCSSKLFSPLKPVSIEQTALAAQTLAQRFQTTAGWRRFAITIADGLSKQEDVLVAALDAGLGDIPVFGGSAGHGLEFDGTYVLHGGAFHEDAALLLIVETDLVFEGVEFDHFMPTERQLVVTQARPDDRIVTEINGAVAADEYARLIGYDVADLSPRVFAENPVLVRNLDNWHVRAIQEVLDDGALTFLSAIENGLVLTLARGKEIIKTMDAELAVTGPRGEAPHFILGFDCVLRRLEIEQKQLSGEASQVLRDRRVLGFNTYGEQHGGVHMNQTFVGIAFFSSSLKMDL